MASKVKIKAVILKKEFSIYVEGKGIRGSFQATGEHGNSFEQVHSIDDDGSGVILVCECEFNHLSHMVKIPYEGVLAIYYADE